MTSPKSYLLRAFYDWIVDNGLTPYVLVDARQRGVEVPLQYVQDGKIILNIAPGAVHTLSMDPKGLSFSARFRGIAQDIHVPLPAIKAVYAKENGRGMVFPEDETTGEAAPDPTPQTPGPQKPGPKKPRKGPSLRVVK
ncbi:MAG TPA: ClpXP protease specificity-enhancing factor [Gammaproteobacteria bacterium]|nr:ClpXP protease specificity-enhancing factor [Gammaproteobacteria bacterium]